MNLLEKNMGSKSSILQKFQLRVVSAKIQTCFLNLLVPPVSPWINLFDSGWRLLINSVAKNQTLSFYCLCHRPPVKEQERGRDGGLGSGRWGKWAWALGNRCHDEVVSSSPLSAQIIHSTGARDKVPNSFEMEMFVAWSQSRKTLQTCFTSW